MAIGVIATLKIQDGKNAEAEAAFTALAEQVRANEPGNRLYQLVKSRTDASTYVVMEIYDDQAAVEAHRKSDHFRAAGPKLGAVLAGAPDVQLYDAV
jgi:quinol monooxygenase YgiN